MTKRLCREKVPLGGFSSTDGNLCRRRRLPGVAEICSTVCCIVPLALQVASLGDWGVPENNAPNYFYYSKSTYC